jgi:addiction module HigA family antidote
MSKSLTTIERERSLPPIHPGKILLEDLRDEDLGVEDLAEAIHVPGKRVALIVEGAHPVDADMAARLGRFFGTSAQYWLNIQNRFDLDLIDHRAIERDVRPRKAA